MTDRNAHDVVADYDDYVNEALEAIGNPETDREHIRSLIEREEELFGEARSHLAKAAAM